jgi:hypothetical protein
LKAKGGKKGKGQGKGLKGKGLSHKVTSRNPKRFFSAHHEEIAFLVVPAQKGVFVDHQ